MEKHDTMGLTLVEGVVALSIMAVIFVLVASSLHDGQKRWHVMQCKHNLRQISNGIQLYEGLRGHFPKESGIRFFLLPWIEKTVERSELSARCYICPGDEELWQRMVEDPTAILTGLRDTTRIHSGLTSYSGRNQADYPLDLRKKSSQAIVSDDDENGLNHADQINVLYLDGSIEEVLLVDFLDESEEFGVGPGVRTETFRVLQ